MKYRVTNRGQPRGFIGLTMTLKPGDNTVDRETVRTMLNRCPRFQTHRDSHQVSVFPGPTPDTNNVRLAMVTDVNYQRDPNDRNDWETYRCRKYEFESDETKELSEDEVNELRTDARFMALSGDILIQGVPEEGDEPEQPKTSSTKSYKGSSVSTKTSTKKTESEGDE